MTAGKVIDIHAHILSEETMRLMREAAPGHGPRLLDIKGDNASLEMSGRVMKTFPRGAWDLEARLRAMDDNGVDMQLLSIVPHTLIYDQDTGVAETLAAVQNDQIAAQVRAMPDRFAGLAHLPLQAPEAAARELRRAMTTLGLKGAMLGSHVAGRNLDDPALEPVWEAAAELGAFILIHPHKGAGADRMTSYYLTNLIGNPLDTTIAAASLVFGGVLRRHPSLIFCLSHGGGFAPFQVGRFVHGWNVRTEPKVHLETSPEADFGRFYYDTITHADHTLKSLIDWAGADRVLLGSDFPFDMGEFDGTVRVRRLGLAEHDQATILGGAAARMLGIGEPAQNQVKETAQ